MNTPAVTGEGGALSVLSMDEAKIRELITGNLGDEPIGLSDLDRVTIPSGGATVWQVDSLTGRENLECLQGILIHWAAVRSMWREEFKGEGTPPDCYSDDSKTGYGDPGGDCASCPFSQFGSDPKGGRGQWCSQKKQLFLLREGQILPMFLSLPPTSLKSMKKYMLRLTSRGVPFFGAVTNLTLEEDSNDDGMKFSKVVMTTEKILEPDQIEKIRSYAESMRPSLRRATREDLNAPTESEG